MKIDIITFKDFLEVLLQICPKSMDNTTERFIALPYSLKKYEREIKELCYDEKWQLKPFYYQELLADSMKHRDVKVFTKGNPVLRVHIRKEKKTNVSVTLCITLTIFSPGVVAWRAEYRVDTQSMAKAIENPHEFLRPAVAEHLTDLPDLYWALADLDLLKSVVQLINTAF